MLTVQQALSWELEGFSGTIVNLDKLTDVLLDTSSGRFTRDADESGLVDRFKCTTISEAPGKLVVTLWKQVFVFKRLGERPAKLEILAVQWSCLCTLMPDYLAVTRDWGC